MDPIQSEPLIVSSDQDNSGLAQAPDEIKLAVDLIYLLETNEVDPETALAALDIVTQDLKLKLSA